MVNLTHTPAPSLPTVINISQSGLNSVLVSWSPAPEPIVTRYIIYYNKTEGPKATLTVAKNKTNATITGLIVGATYVLEIVANSTTLPSEAATSPAITIG